MYKKREQWLSVKTSVWPRWVINWVIARHSVIIHRTAISDRSPILSSSFSALEHVFQFHSRAAKCDFILSLCERAEPKEPTMSFLLFSSFVRSLWSRCYLQMACIPAGFNTFDSYAECAKSNRRRTRKGRCLLNEWNSKAEICMKGKVREWIAN